MKSLDSVGGETQFTYDAWLRTKTSKQRIDSSSFATTTMTYDVFWNVKSVQDPNSILTSYTYNKLNQLTQESKTGLGARQYWYDGVGNPVKVNDRNGRITEWSYDSTYRPENERWNGSEVYEYEYDNADRLIEIDDKDDVRGTDFQFSYDSDGRLNIESQFNKLLGTRILFDRNYDSVGNRTRLQANFGGSFGQTYISGGTKDFENAYTYDGLNRLDSVTQKNYGGNSVAPKLARFSYNAASQLTDIKRYSATYSISSTFESHNQAAD